MIAVPSRSRLPHPDVGVHAVLPIKPSILPQREPLRANSLLSILVLGHNARRGGRSAALRRSRHWLSLEVTLGDETLELHGAS